MEAEALDRPGPENKNLGPGPVHTNWGPSRGPGAGKYRDP